MTAWQTDQMTGWLTDWMTAWLTDKMTRWLNDWMTGWVSDWPNDQMTEWLNNRKTKWLNEMIAVELSKCLNKWLNDWPGREWFNRCTYPPALALLINIFMRHPIHRIKRTENGNLCSKQCLRYIKKISKANDNLSKLTTNSVVPGI